MRSMFLPVLLVLACAGSSGSSDGSSREPSDHTTYPPKMVEGENVKDGVPTDPEIAACLEKKQAIGKGVFEAIAGEGEKSSVDDTESNFEVCWCQSKGYRGIKMDHSCK